MIEVDSHDGYPTPGSPGKVTLGSFLNCFGVVFGPSCGRLKGRLGVVLRSF